MATITVTHQTADSEALDTIFGNNLVSSFGKEGVVHTKVFQFTNDTGANIAANSIIEFGVINNCLILNSSGLINSALGSGVTFDLGIQEYYGAGGTVVTGDIDALVDGAAMENATKTTFAALTSGANPGGYRVTGQTQLMGKILGAVMPDAGVITVILDFIPYKG